MIDLDNFGVRTPRRRRRLPQKTWDKRILMWFNNFTLRGKIVMTVLTIIAAWLFWHAIILRILSSIFYTPIQPAITVEPLRISKMKIKRYKTQEEIPVRESRVINCYPVTEKRIATGETYGGYHIGDRVYLSENIEDAMRTLARENEDLPYIVPSMIEGAFFPPVCAVFFKDEFIVNPIGTEQRSSDSFLLPRDCSDYVGLGMRSGLVEEGAREYYIRQCPNLEIHTHTGMVTLHDKDAFLMRAAIVDLVFGMDLGLWFDYQSKNM